MSLLEATVIFLLFIGFFVWARGTAEIKKLTVFVLEEV